MGRSTTIKNDKELEICDRHCFGFTYTTRWLYQTQEVVSTIKWGNLTFLFLFRLDNKEGKHENPLFLKRALNLDNELYVAGYPYDVFKGFVGCIRGLVSFCKDHFCLCHENILILHCKCVQKRRE